MVEPATAIAVASLVAAALAWTLAGVVLWTSWSRPSATLLTAVLVVEGLLQLGTAGNMLPPGSAWSMLTGSLAGIAFFTLPWVDLRLLRLLDTPLVTRLRSPAGRRLTAGALAFALAWALAAAVSDFVPALLALQPVAVALGFVTLLAWIGVMALGLAAGVSAYGRAAPRTLARERARAFAIAFGIRNATLATVAALVFLIQVGAVVEGWFLAVNALVAAGTLAFVPLLTFGILRTNLLDLDARLRWTVERGTVAAAFIAVYVAASQAASSLVAPQFGFGAGILAAAALVLALAPLQRWAERVAAATVPSRDAGPAPDARSLEVYRVALDELMGEGGLDARSKDVLAKLRDRLGLTERDHAVAEHFVRTGRAPPRPGGFAPGDKVLGRFRVVRALGEGGQARAHLAEDLQLSRLVVLKSFRPDRGLDVVLREARTIAAIRSPYVATVYDVHAMGDHALLVLEFVDGGSLKERLRAGAVDPDTFARIGHDLCAALEAVHSAGIVHRDVKPGNLLLTRTGGAKLADFGIAAMAGTDATRADVVDFASAMGTVPYMSPEQARGAPATPRSDLYAAAVTMFEAWTGRPYVPWHPDESAAEVMARVARPPPFPGLPGAPAGVEAWFTRALSPDPSHRFADARAMKEALPRALALPAAVPADAQGSP